MIKPTDEMIEAFEKASGRAVGRDSLAGLAAVLAIVERDLPRCPYVEWGYRVRLCSLPIGHNGSHELKERVLS